MILKEDHSGHTVEEVPRARKNGREEPEITKIIIREASMYGIIYNAPLLRFDCNISSHPKLLCEVGIFIPIVQIKMPRNKRLSFYIRRRCSLIGKCLVCFLPEQEPSVYGAVLMPAGVNTWQNRKCLGRNKGSSYKCRVILLRRK